MRKIAILVLGMIFCIALKNEAQNNEPTIVSIEMVADSSKGNTQVLRVYPDIHRNENFLLSRLVLRSGVGVTRDFYFIVIRGPAGGVGITPTENQQLNLANTFSIEYHYSRSDTSRKRLECSLKGNMLTVNTYSWTPRASSGYELISTQQYAFQETPLNKFALILKQTSNGELEIDKMIPYDSEVYQKYERVKQNPKILRDVFLSPYRYKAYLLGPDDSPEKRREFEQKVRSASKLSQEELDKWLLDSE